MSLFTKRKTQSHAQKRTRVEPVKKVVTEAATKKARITEEVAALPPQVDEMHPVTSRAEVDNHRFEVGNHKAEVGDHEAEVDKLHAELDKHGAEVDNRKATVDKHIPDMEDQKHEANKHIPQGGKLAHGTDINIAVAGPGRIPADQRLIPTHLSPHDHTPKAYSDRTGGKKPRTGREHAIALPNTNTIRASLRTDYQRDICTQFLKTGRCRYGDSCKFLHEREDVAVKPGTGTKWKDRQRPASPVSTPTGCAICSKDPVDPVKPQCAHKCCQSCFIKASKTHGTCRVCGAEMSGSADVVN